MPKDRCHLSDVREIIHPKYHNDQLPHQKPELQQSEDMNCDYLQAQPSQLIQNEQNIDNKNKISRSLIFVSNVSDASA